MECAFPSGAEGIRTPDLYSAIVALSRLSHSPILGATRRVSKPTARIITLPSVPLYRRLSRKGDLTQRKTTNEILE